MDTHFQENWVQVKQQSVHRGLGLPGELTRTSELNYGRTAPWAPQIISKQATMMAPLL